MLASAPIQLAREKLSDEFAGADGSGYRWSNSSMLRHLNNGLLELYRLRPDCVIYGGEIRTEQPTPLVIADPADITQAVGVADQYVEALAFWLAGKCLMDDSEHAANAERAAGYLSEFGRLLS